MRKNSIHPAAEAGTSGHGKAALPPSFPLFGQRPGTFEKYHDAILACSAISYIGLTVSGIAREFGLSPAGLNNQLRRHFPEVIQEREALRRRLGIADGNFRGATPTSINQYARAVHLLQTTDVTVLEAARRCRVSYSGLREHILYYHKRIAEARQLARAAAAAEPFRYGKKTGNNQRHLPRAETVKRYAPALEMLQTTAIPLSQICILCGIRCGAFRSYLYKWHPEDLLRRRQESDLSEELPVALQR